MLRSAILGFVIAGLFVAYQFYVRNKDDWNDLVKVDTNGWIAMLEYAPNGTQVALLKPDGTLVHDKGYTEGAADREITWSPDGNFVFFVSDRVIETERQNRTVNVYRWSPAHEKAEPRTVGGRSRGNPTFPDDKTAKKPLIVSAGEVLELDPHDQKTTTLLPPRGREISKGREEEGAKGAENPFSAAYGQLGTSFRIAKWAKNKTWIAAVMRRDQGEILVCQSLDSKEDSPPLPLIAGAHIDIEINPVSGDLIYAVRDFQWVGEVPAQFKKGNKVSRPYAHCLGSFSFDKGKPPTIIAAEDSICFSGLAPSPDGKSVLFTAGTYDGDGSMTPKSLVMLSLEDRKGNMPTRLAAGEIYDPSWHPNGTQILFTRKLPDGNKAIFRLLKDGGGEKQLTPAGSFGLAKFSPQTQ